MNAPVESLTVHDLRRKWKPVKLRLQSVPEAQPTLIRVHRACSWLRKIETLGEAGDSELVLLLGWVAFNSLYGQWDPERCEPMNDGECWKKFTSRVLVLDQERLIAGMLEANKPLVMSLLQDEYLSGWWWEHPEDAERAGKSRKVVYDARSWYVEKKWGMILDRVLERIYLMRCQLAHGAATHGSTLNRTSLRRCATMLGHLVPVMLRVLIERGGEAKWGSICYPPQAGANAR